jgi:hypothetical protein
MKLPRVTITSFYPKVEFLDGQYLGDGPYNTCYQGCDYCKDFKKIYVRNKPVYYQKGAKRKLVSYCKDCYGAVLEGGQIMIADNKIVAKIAASTYHPENEVCIIINEKGIDDVR